MVGGVANNFYSYWMEQFCLLTYILPLSFTVLGNRATLVIIFLIPLVRLIRTFTHGVYHWDVTQRFAPGSDRESSRTWKSNTDAEIKMRKHSVASRASWEHQVAAKTGRSVSMQLIHVPDTHTPQLLKASTRHILRPNIRIVSRVWASEQHGDRCCCLNSTTAMTYNKLQHYSGWMSDVTFK